jgi:predicted SprT family Zn-dependent metalloprotease
MSLYHSSQPAAISNFQQNTEKHASMSGVQFQRFRCKCCGINKQVKGRKQITDRKRDGYRCADCATKKEGRDGA